MKKRKTHFLNEKQNLSPLNRQTIQAPFLGNPPLLLLKVTSFLVKISQFGFLVTTKKNIFAHIIIFFCHSILQILVYFLYENCNSPEKSKPFFPSNSSKSWDPVKSPLFENLVGGSNSPTIPRSRKVGGRGEESAHYLSTMLYCEITPLNCDVTCSKL